MISSNNVKGEFAIMPEIVAKETIFVPKCCNNPFSGILPNYCSLRVNLGTIYPYNSCSKNNSNIFVIILYCYYVLENHWEIPLQVTNMFPCDCAIRKRKYKEKGITYLG